MTLSEIRSLVRGYMTRTMHDAKQLGVHSDFTDKELDIWINQVYKEFCGKTGLLVKSASLTLSNGVAVMPESVVDVKIVSFNDVPIGSVNRYSLTKHPDIA